MSLKDGTTNAKRHQKRLFQAVIRGKVQQLRDVLSDSGVDVNAYDIDSRTPLMHSVVLENVDARTPVIRCLVDAGADVNAKDADGKTALMYAVSDRENDAVVKVLLDSSRCDPNVQDLEGNTALMHAVNSDNIKAIRALVNVNSINEAVDIKLTNKHGYSALLMAVKLRREECCRVLVREAKADPTAVSKHWQGTLARILEGGCDANGKKSSLQKGRRASVGSIPSALRKPLKASSPNGSWSKPQVDFGTPSFSSTRRRFNNKSALPQGRAAVRERRNSGLRSQESGNHGVISDASQDQSPDEDDTESLRDILNSFELTYRPAASREQSQSSLLSESTLTMDWQGRPRTMRESSDSSIDTLTTYQSRPNTRQDSDLSIRTLDGCTKGRSPKFPRETSAVFRRNVQQPCGDLRSGRRTSWSRPSTSLVMQPMVPWSNSRDSAWLETLTTPSKMGHVPRTISSLSSYKHGIHPQGERFQFHPQKLSPGKSAKETALKHIRGSLRLPLTPTPSSHRVFSREDKSTRCLPAIAGSKH